MPNWQSVHWKRLHLILKLISVTGLRTYLDNDTELQILTLNSFIYGKSIRIPENELTMMAPTPQKRQRYTKNVNKQHGATEKWLPQSIMLKTRHET